MKNKYGLARDIKDSIKEVVRKRDGFGCVHCGRGIYTYEHFDPPFKDAKIHDSNGICLLCGQCQIATTKGQLSKATIRNDVMNPFCKRQGYSNDFLDLKYPVVLHLGNIVMKIQNEEATRNILVLNNEVAISCSKDPAGGPLQISSIFRDKDNKVILRIDKNEWKVSVYSWDVRQVGKRLEIFNGTKDIGIALEVNPPHAIYFTKLNTYFNGSRLFLSSEGIMVIKKANGQELKIDIPNEQEVRSLNVNL